MKPIQFNTIITRISTRADNSLGLTLSTPELDNDATLVMLRLRGINLDCTLTPLGEAPEAPHTVKAEIETKTPAQRQRAIIFCLYKHDLETQKLSPGATFEPYYESKMDRICEHLKKQLPE